MNARVRVLGVAGLVLAFGSAAMAGVTIKTVPVGNPGNTADTRYATPGYGAVSYEFNIGKYEVTAGQYTEFLNKVAGVDAYGLYNTSMWSRDYGCKIERYAGSGTTGDPYQYQVDGNWANRPVTDVSWGDAARFSNWLHNDQPTGEQDLSTTEDGAYHLNGATSNEALLAVTREADWKWAITSEDEWYKAAYYNPPTGTYFDYPTSSNSVPSNDLINPDPGNNATFYDSGYTISSPYWRTEVGAHENSESPYGTFDQGGNVFEYNEAVIYGLYRGTRGGTFLIDDWWMLASTRCYVVGPGLEAISQGFRVAEVPEPASAAVLLIGGLGVVPWRRRKKGN